MFCRWRKSRVSRCSAWRRVVPANSSSRLRPRERALPKCSLKACGSAGRGCSSTVFPSLVALNALDRGKFTMLFATGIIHHPDVGSGLVHETRAPILGECAGIVDGDDVFELLAALDLAYTLMGAQLVCVRRARIVEKGPFIEPRRFNDQDVAFPAADGVAG